MHSSKPTKKFGYLYIYLLYRTAAGRVKSGAEKGPAEHIDKTPVT